MRPRAALEGGRARETRRIVVAMLLRQFVHGERVGGNGYRVVTSDVERDTWPTGFRRWRGTRNSGHTRMACDSVRWKHDSL